VIAFYLLRPSLPFIEYAITREHIEKEHCIQKDNPENTCHGKCYLHEQLNKQSESQDSDTKDDKTVPDNKIDDHLQAYSIIPGIYEKYLTVPDCFIVPGTVSRASRIFVPPKHDNFQDLFLHRSSLRFTFHPIINIPEHCSEHIFHLIHHDQVGCFISQTLFKYNISTL
jgi:hypothetical protein